MLEHMFLFTFNQRNEHVSLSTFLVIFCVLCIKPIEVKATRQELWPKNAENRNQKKKSENPRYKLKISFL